MISFNLSQNIWLLLYEIDDKVHSPPPVISLPVCTEFLKPYFPLPT